MWQAREEQSNSLLSILNLLRSGTEEQALTVLQRIRSEASLPSTLSSATSTDAQSIESLRQLYTDAQATIANQSIASASNVTSPVSEHSGSGPSTYSRADSESSADSRKLQCSSASRDGKIDRLTLDYIINDGTPEASASSSTAPSAAQNIDNVFRRASASDADSTARRTSNTSEPHAMEALRSAGSAPAHGSNISSGESVSSHDFARPEDEPASNTSSSDWNKYYSDVSTLLQSMQKPGPQRPL